MIIIRSFANCMSELEDDIELNLEALEDCIRYEKQDDEYTLPGEFVDTFDIHLRRLVDLLSEAADFDSLSPEYYRISFDRLSNLTQDAIEDIKSKEVSLPDNSQARIEWITDYIDSQLDPPSDSTVLFPLNVSSDLNWPNSFSVDNYSISQISDKEWMDQYHSRFRSNVDSKWDTAELPNSIYQDDRQLSDKFTMWKIENIYARNRKYSVDLASDMIQYVLSKINFSHYQTKVSTRTVGSGMCSGRISELLGPYIFISDKNGVMELYYDNKFIMRKPVDIEWNDDQNDRYNRLSNSFGLDSGFQGTINKALQAYDSGVTSSSNSDAFFNFWRGLEILTLTNDTEPLTRVVERASAMIQFDGPLPVDMVISQIRGKRNAYVHEAKTVHISDQDVRYTKMLLDNLLKQCVVWCQGGSTEEQIRFAYDNVGLDTNTLEMKAGVLAEILEDR